MSGPTTREKALRELRKELAKQKKKSRQLPSFKKENWYQATAIAISAAKTLQRTDSPPLVPSVD